MVQVTSCSSSLKPAWTHVVKLWNFVEGEQMEKSWDR